LSIDPSAVTADEGRTASRRLTLRSHCPHVVLSLLLNTSPNCFTRSFPGLLPTARRRSSISKNRTDVARLSLVCLCRVFVDELSECVCNAHILPCRSDIDQEGFVDCLSGDFVQLIISARETGALSSRGSLVRHRKRSGVR
jgi:hypothetical protein